MGLQQRLDAWAAAEPANSADYRTWMAWHEWQKFGQDYGNTHPEAGMAATIRIGSDTYAATVSRVGKGRLWVRKDRAIRTDQNGQSEDQRYLYVPDENGEELLFYWSEKRKRWVFQSYTLFVGVRRTYLDPHF